MRIDDKAIFDLDPREQSVDARLEIMGILHKSIRDIELQLGSKERTDINGARLAADVYAAWRKGAIKAMNHRVELYRKYKTLEKLDERKRAQAEPLSEVDAASGD